MKNPLKLLWVSLDLNNHILIFFRVLGSIAPSVAAKYV